MRLKLTLVALAALGIVFACKPQDGSDTKALDNFAGGTDVHVCSGKYKSRLKEDALHDPKNLKAEVERALTSVPEGIQDIYFGPMRGRISVTPDAPAICSGVGNAGKTGEEVASCWYAVGGAPVIFVRSTVSDVRHLLVRGIGYWVSEELIHGKDLYPDKRRIGQALLADVARSKQFDLYVFGKYLDGKILEKTISDEERNKRLDALPFPVHSVSRDVFYDYAYAEAFDSYYCNGGTRNTLGEKKEFEKTGKVFREFTADLEALNVKSLQASTKLTGDGGLSLTGDSGEGLNLFGRFRTGSIIGNIRARRNAGYGVFQQNGPLRRAWRGTVGNSTQFGTTAQINYTGNRTQTFQVAGGNYERQPDGSFGWVPTGSPSGFRPTYFANPQSNGTWSYTGEVAPKPQTAGTQSFAGNPTATSTGSATVTATTTSTGSATATTAATSTNTATGISAGVGSQSFAGNTPTVGSTVSTVPPTVNPNATNPSPTATNPATATVPPVTNNPTATVPPVTNNPTATVPPVTNNPTATVPPVTNNPATQNPQPVVNPTQNPLVTNQPLPNLATLNPNQFAPNSGNNQIEGGGVQVPATQPQVKPLNPNPFGPGSGNDKEIKESTESQP